MTMTVPTRLAPFDGQVLHACGTLLTVEQLQAEQCPSCHRRLKSEDVKPLVDLFAYAQTWLRAFNGKFGMRDAFQALVLLAIQQHRDHLEVLPMVQTMRGFFGRSSEAVTSLQSAFLQLEELLLKYEFQDETVAAATVPGAGPAVLAPAPVFQLAAR